MAPSSTPERKFATYSADGDAIHEDPIQYNLCDRVVDLAQLVLGLWGAVPITQVRLHPYEQKMCEDSKSSMRDEAIRMPGSLHSPKSLYIRTRGNKVTQASRWCLLSCASGCARGTRRPYRGAHDSMGIAYLSARTRGIIMDHKKSCGSKIRFGEITGKLSTCVTPRISKTYMEPSTNLRHTSYRAGKP